jgi:hypothetical protein
MYTRFHFRLVLLSFPKIHFNIILQFMFQVLKLDAVAVYSEVLGQRMQQDTKYSWSERQTK